MTFKRISMDATLTTTLRAAKDPKAPAALKPLIDQIKRDAIKSIRAGKGYAITLHQAREVNDRNKAEIQMDEIQVTGLTRAVYDRIIAVISSELIIDDREEESAALAEGFGK